MATSIKERLKHSMGILYRRFLKLRGDPHAIAMGLAFGVFVGLTPLMGLHSVIAVAGAALLKWSKIAALIGVFVTNPVTAPLIYPLTYTLGATILGNPVTIASSGGLDLGDLVHSSPQVLSNLFVGGAIVGLAGGAVSYVIALRTIRRYRHRRRRRAEGDAPFAAVRKRLRRVARRQRRRAQRREKHKQARSNPLRHGRRSRRHRRTTMRLRLPENRRHRQRQPAAIAIRPRAIPVATTTHVWRLP
ncbi:MAG: DUF2062 domain-containing protein [Desulfosarcinaceae bacterium]|nr:DUF2062 domain-containing protein [Desulfosarcinaceae bacterium]